MNKLLTILIPTIISRKECFDELVKEFKTPKPQNPKTPNLKV